MSSRTRQMRLGRDESGRKAAKYYRSFTDRTFRGLKKVEHMEGSEGQWLVQSADRN